MALIFHSVISHHPHSSSSAIRVKFSSLIYIVINFNFFLNTSNILATIYRNKNSAINKITKEHRDLPWGNPIREKTPAKIFLLLMNKLAGYKTLIRVLQYK